MTPVHSSALIRVCGLLSAVGMLAAACTSATPPAAQPTAPSASGGSAPTSAPAPKPTQAASAKSGGRVVFGSFSDMKTFSPVLASDNVSAYMWGRVYATLLSTDAKTAELEPGLAEKFSTSDDGKTLTFVLRDGLKWSDGSPLTGDDFKFTVEAVMRSKQTPRKSNFQDIVGAKDFGEGKAESISGIKVDGRTITVELQQVFCPAMTTIGGFGIIPRGEFGKYLDPKDPTKNLDEAPENKAPRLASGPFTFKEWVPNDHVTLARNDLYYGGKPLLDEFVNKVVPDATALAAALKTGEVDVSPAVDAKDIEDLKRVDSLGVSSYVAPSYTFIGWNQLRGGKEFLQSKLLRQAFAYGLNMQQVVDKVYFGEAQKMVAHTPPGSWAYNTAGMNEYPYDPKKAQELIEQDGWKKGTDGVYEKNGQKLAFEIVTNSGNKPRETLLQVAAEQYKQIGVDVTPRTESFEALVDRIQKSKDPKYGEQGGHDFDAVIIGWSLSTDPDAYNTWHSTQVGTGKFNLVSYQNPALDKALEQGRTSCGTEQRKSAYQTMNKILNEEQPYNFGLAPKTVLAVNRRIAGVDAGPWSNREEGVLWNLDRWSIK